MIKPSGASSKDNVIAVLKRAIFLFLPVFGLLLVVVAAFFWVEMRSVRNVLEKSEQYTVDMGMSLVCDDIAPILGDLGHLSSHIEYGRLFDQVGSFNPQVLKDVGMHFLFISASHKLYDQIRLLDDKGMELIRVNYNQGAPALVPQSELQNKARRYYFRDTISLGPGEIFISPFDLNIERGEVERPFKPMIRFGTPIYDKKGRKRGVLILNYLGAHLLDRFEISGRNGPFEPMLVNSEGYWLKGRKPLETWGFMFNDRHGAIFSNSYRAAWKRIETGNSGQFETEKGLFTYATVYPLKAKYKSTTGSGEPAGASKAWLTSRDYYWKIISHLPPSVIYQKRNTWLVWGLGLLAFFSVILGIGTWKVARSGIMRRQAERALQKAKDQLEIKVEERTAELKESEEKYRSIMESMEDTVYICSPDYRVEYLNPAMAERIGSETLGKRCFSALYSLEDKCPWCIHKIVQQGESQSHELTSPTDDRTYLTSNNPIFHEDGTVSKLTVFRDITELKQVEVNLKKSTHDLGKRLHELNCLYALSNLIDDPDETTPELLQKAAELIPTAWQYPEITCARISFEDRVFRTRNFQESPWRQASDILVFGEKAGEVEVLYLEERPVLDEGPFLKEERSLINDIAERLGTTVEHRRTEEEKRKGEAKYQKLVETMNEGLSMVDEKGNFAYVNHRFCEIVGRTSDQLIGRHLTEYLEPASRDIWEKEFAARRKGDTDPYELEWITKKGDTVITAVSPAIFTDQTGRFGGSFAIFSDITEQRRAAEEKRVLETQLQQVQKMEAIGTLAGGIAHDFNNVLSAIIGYGYLAVAQLPVDHPIQSHLSQMLKASDRASDLVKQILSFSRQAKQEMKPVMIGPIVKEVLKLIRASMPATIEIRQDIAADSGSSLADPTQIHQVIMNLCTNACHAMRKKGGTLSVNLENLDIEAEDAARHRDLAPGLFVRLSVSDTGHGMSRELVEQIFDPFFTTKETGEGTGLGLSVVHGIIRDFNGAIKVYSEPGKGATFQVYLPRLEDEAEDRSALLAAPPPIGTERILFVDDEETLVDIGKQTLEPLGYLVTGLTSSVEALKLFESQPEGFDLVITDQTMPKMTGAEMSREMLRIRPDIPIVVCSGFSEQLSHDQAEGLGIKRFLMKPLIARQLAHTIREVLE